VPAPARPSRRRFSGVGGAHRRQHGDSGVRHRHDAIRGVGKFRRRASPYHSAWCWCWPHADVQPGAVAPGRRLGLLAAPQIGPPAEASHRLGLGGDRCGFACRGTGVLWVRVGRALVRRPGAIWLMSVAILAPFAVAAS